MSRYNVLMSTEKQLFIYLFIFGQGTFLFVLFSLFMYKMEVFEIRIIHIIVSNKFIILEKY